MPSCFPTKRRVMRTFKLNEISVVDTPAQEGAKIVMVKSGEAREPTAQEFCKVGFREALQERQMERAFCDAFYEAFDGIWTLNDAFMEALKDRFNDGEQVAREYIEVITDKALAAVAATRNLTKASNPVGAFSMAVVEAATAKKEADMDRNQLTKAIAEFEKNGGTNEQISQIKKAAADLGATDLLPSEGALAVSTAEARAQAAEAEIAKRDAIDGLSDEARKFYDGLNAEDGAAFLAKSAEEQDMQIAEANAVDPVVYTTKSGIAVHKSAGSTIMAMAKQLDAVSEENAALRAEKASDGFAKSASEDYPNLPHESTVAMLKAASTMSEADAAAIKAGLKAQNDAQAADFTFTGGAGAPVNKNAQGELDQLVKAYAKSNNVSESVALASVLDTDQGQQLYVQVEGAANPSALAN